MSRERESPAPGTATSWFDALVGAVAFLGQMPGVHLPAGDPRSRTPAHPVDPAEHGPTDAR